MKLPLKIPFKLDRGAIAAFAVVALIIVLASLPLFAGTSTYPLTVVNGNSMVPALHNGDLVYYTAPRGPVKNGTIIVFIQGETGVNSLDSFLKPIVIHRVVGFGYEPDGSLYYETKGDNNAADDPFTTPASSILGVETTAVPYAGFPVQFLQSAYGMITVVAVMSLFYFSGVDTRMWAEDERKRLITAFANHSLEGRIGSDQFEKLKMIIESSGIPEDLLKDTSLLSMSQWLREGGLDEDWREETGSCPKCGNSAYHIIGTNESFVVCPHCIGHDKQVRSSDVGTAQRSSWAEWLFTGSPSQEKRRLEPQWNSKDSNQCSDICTAHHATCDLRKNHLRRHHHMTLDGSLCFFEVQT
jgi:signal peptidase I